jgi:NADH-quinone oxidoreductase subunit C
VDLQEQSKYIKENFSQNLKIPKVQNDNLIIYVAKDNLIEFLTFLRDNKKLSFKVLLDVFGADMLGVRTPRFEVIYNLLSLKLNNRIIVKIAINDKTSVPSACKIFSAANWYEREVFDMYGIKFSEHPDLRRILTDYGFEGHPLRKDFPLTGYKEVRYDEEQKKVIYEDVKLAQEYRNFDFETPWEGTDYTLPGDEKASS